MVVAVDVFVPEYSPYPPKTVVFLSPAHVVLAIGLKIIASTAAR